ncbi:pyridoxamine 5'-phosphate oxidase family protein [Nonomuraea glycinis]|uniref:pyridoxamine 5'-phosphate oxidase family protein n=1 Tax=Nonomuraea glycinis TaxID=2047744 RepID=UPI001CD9D90A|nr:pyridoxamine 5'-phosphate oxidase family protein [Nonomuraea glycinis]MCA2181535.1 pyridoxamine 5'-phosphate oxidase family protein [Nonomuraea glycinis]
MPGSAALPDGHPVGHDLTGPVGEVAFTDGAMIQRPGPMDDTADRRGLTSATLATVNAPARTLDRRIRDTLDRLERDVDGWFATADPAGLPYLMPLSFLWDGRSLLISTARTNPTARFLEATGKVRVALGPTRDVVLIDAEVREVIAAAEIPAETGDAFAAKAGFDPREQRGAYPYFRIVPLRIQAWREVNELAQRDVMIDGKWLSTPGTDH